MSSGVLIIGLCLGVSLAVLCTLAFVLWRRQSIKDKKLPSQDHIYAPPTRTNQHTRSPQTVSQIQTIPKGNVSRTSVSEVTTPPPSDTRYRIPEDLKGLINLGGEFGRVLDQLITSHQDCFITGKAGTGKSTLLRIFVENAKRKVVLLAPTGIAAVNIGGETIHSFFRFPPRPLHKDDIQPLRDKSLYRAVETLVIDEVSMVRADLMDAIDIFMRLNGRDKSKPFGGVQLVLFGDPFQLPPIVASEEAEFFATYFESPFFFHSNAIQNLPLEKIELTRVYRQTDKNFIRLLDAFRTGEVCSNDLLEINQRHIPHFQSQKDDSNITLTTRNDMADEINAEQAQSSSL